MEPAGFSADVVAYLSDPGAEGFAEVTGPRALRFPEDAGAHPEYQTEWWYYTGNLADPDGRRFGFQLTFFRRALAPAGDQPPRESAWASEQIYLAHFALSDVEAGRFHSAERLARGALGLAGAEASPFRVWVEDWSAEGATVGDRSVAEETADVGSGVEGSGRVDVAEDGSGGLRLRASEGPVSIDLELAPVKPPALHGDRGFSPKGEEPGNASFYYSYSRLAGGGRITTEGGSHAVEGLAWMDHEWSTSALAEQQVGWDWFSLQLDDGREVMAFQLRESGGGISSASSGSVIAADASVSRLGREDFTIEPLGRWTSPRSGAVYPSAWRLRIPQEAIDLEIQPLIEDQELDLNLRYWEGAVRVSGRSAGRPIAGYGYVELTGYIPGGGRGPGVEIKNSTDSDAEDASEGKGTDGKGDERTVGDG
jgi:predicted secreted hydrolase